MLTTVTDAWHTLVPPAGDRHGPLPLLLVLTVVTGLVDAFSYLVLGHVFVANMTGNVVFLAFALAGAKGFSAGRLGPGPGRLRRRGRGQRPDRRPSRARGGVGCWPVHGTSEAVLVAVAVVVGWTVTTPGSGRTALRAGRPARPGRGHAERHGPEAGRARPDHHRADPDHRRGRLRQPAGRRDRLADRAPGPAAVAMFLGRAVGALTVLKVSRPRRPALALVLLVTVAVVAGHLSRSRPDLGPAA